MICLYCKENFTPKYNPNTKRETKYCSRSCIAKHNLKKLAKIKFPQLRDKDWLFDQYWIKKRSMKDISRGLGCAESKVYISMDKFGISRRRIGESLIGKKKSIKHRMNLSKAAKNRWRGKNNPNWKGGFGKKTLKARHNVEYEIWRKYIKRKYGEHCGKCGKDLTIDCSCCGQPQFQYVHHIKSVEKFPELVIDPENGILLCYSCHRENHN